RQCSTKIILTKRRLCLLKKVVKPIVRVEIVVSQVVECGAMPLVSSRTGHKGKLPAWIAAIFGGIRGALNAKLLKRIDRHERLSGPKRCACRHRTSTSRSIRHSWKVARICTDAIYSIVI